MIVIALFACSPPAEPPAGALADRAYAVSADSNELFVFDYETLEEVGSIDTTVSDGLVNSNHMAIVTPDATKVYVTAAAAGQLVIIDAAALEVTGILAVGAHPSHMAFRRGTNELWVMAEDDDAVVVVDTATDTIARVITDETLHAPHFARFSGDFAYVPNLAGNQISVVDLASYTVADVLVTEGREVGACEGDPCGFADAMIDPNGVLFASHFETGQVLIYDTLAGERVPDARVGPQTWSAFVDPFGEDEPFALVPSWTTATVSRVGVDGGTEIWSGGDSEVYGVNFSPTDRDAAFVLDRSREAVRVLGRETGELLDTIDVGGTVETGTTTPNGLLLLPIGSAGAVTVIDTATREELARFSEVGTYPWSVATADGQNYCH